VSSPSWETIGPPPLSLFVREQGRAALELARIGPRRKALEAAPHGDGHLVLVLPGLLAGDFSTIPLRRFLRALSYDARAWGLGINVGPNDALRQRLDALLMNAHRACGQRVSLIGWSLGGIYARELARAHPEAVRCLITLATPFRDISATHAARLVPIRPGGRSLRDAHDLRAYLRTPVPVPTTSIFSKTDGIVHWQSCLETEGPERENVEVSCSHTGMGFHAEVLAVLADRLAQPVGGWQRYAKRS